MKKYTEFIIKHKKKLFVLFILLNIAAIFGIVRIQLDTDFASFSPDESVYQDRLDEIEGTFGQLNQLIVIVEVDEINDAVISDLSALQITLSTIDDISYVQGATPEVLFIGGTSVPILNLSSEDIISYYQNFGEFSPLKVNEGTDYFVYTLFISEDFTNQSIGDIEEALDDIAYTSYISGDSYNQLKITDYIVKILLILPPLALIIIFSVFRWQMGAMKPTVLSVLPAGIGSLWTFGIIGWIGNEVSILTAVVPIFIIVIGSADGLHFMSHFQDSKRDGLDYKESIISTLKLVGVPMIVTTLTSMAGFLSLLSISSASIVDLSLYSAIGILLAGIATWYVLPLILSNDINVSKKKAHKEENFFADNLKKLTGLPSLLIVLVILLVATFSFSNINNEFNMLMVYKESTIVSKNAEKVSEVNGGSIPVYVTLHTNANIISLEARDEINILASELDTLDEVNKVVNPYDLIDIVYNNMMGGEIPNNIALDNVVNSLMSDPNSTIHDLISEDDNVVRLLVFPRDLENATLDTIEATVDELDIDTNVTGVQYLMTDLNNSISAMQINSIILALSIVLIMLIVTLRSFKIAFFSLIPIIITVIALYGFLGVSGIPLNITTVIIFSITIGVGIDYAVHFSSVYQYYYKETGDKILAIDKAYSNSSRPIITNALGISLGLSALMLSPLTIHFNVSVLMWISMIVSVVLTLTLLPFILGKRKA